MSLDNTITTLANWIGRNLYYIFKFFENLSVGFVIFMAFILIFLIVVFYFRFMKKEMERLAE